MSEKKYYMANPNFSEGKHPEIVNKIVDTIKDMKDVIMVKCEPEGEFNRTVLTLVGEEQPLINAITTLTKACKENIDIRKHVGTHPRMGVMDVIPIFPFHNTTIDEAVELGYKLGENIFKETQIPIFYTCENASVDERKSLPFIRKGQYEGLKKILQEAKNDPQRATEYEMRKPDISSDGLLDETAGGTVVAAMKDIPAFFNVFLDTEDLSIAKTIANSIRSATGGFSTVTAIGIKFAGRPGTVVSMNVMDISVTPIYRPFEVVKMEAERYGARVTGSELVGIVRLDFLVDCFKHQLQLEGFKKEHIIETCLF
ncbi:MAG: glutamate formimidoyltransferase [Eubacteriaceae bacterium]|jgi:glutamate formiminotransferase/formiminotetrahydrofolate cyclodeaminase|nr:glutamate formimidoyltransferase [Eubacteriaceae bacterium]